MCNLIHEKSRALVNQKYQAEGVVTWFNGNRSQLLSNREGGMDLDKQEGLRGAPNRFDR